MALKYLPKSWRDDMRTNFAHKHNFYINPRNRVFPAMTSAGVTYIKNDVSTNMRGTYRMQCGASTNLTYLYTLPQRFILEGWFKPEFAYDVAWYQTIFAAADAAEFSLIYNATTDKFDMIQSHGTTLSSTAFTATADLQKWVYVRAFYDNSAKLAGLYMTVNGVSYSDAQNVPGAGPFLPLNAIAFMPAVAAESSYWIIHELDETLATGDYKTYKADRQIIFDFNGTTLGRERLRIPVVHEVADDRGVLAFDFRKGVDAPMTGNPGANSAGITFKNINGQFSDDQYDAFDPFNGRYNGTQKYLQNRVPIEIDSESPANTVRDSLLAHYSFHASDGTDNSGYGNTMTLSGGTFLDGNYDKLLDLNGTTDYATMPKQTLATGTLCFSWKTAVNSDTHIIFCNNVSSAGNLSYIRQRTGGALLIHVSNGVTDVPRTLASYFLYDNIEHNYAITITTTAILCYRDGTYIGGWVEGWTGYSLKLYYVGRYTGAGYYSDGSIGNIRIYNAVKSATQIAEMSADPADWGALSKMEPLFIGRTVPGAFRRTSPSKYNGEARVEAEDCVAELGEARLPVASAFDTYKLSDPTTEASSLFHAITRLVTKKEIRNYALNSSIENATIANSWTNSGMATFERSNTYAQFGTYSMKCIADAAGDKVTQIIKFESTDKIDVGDVFNFSAFIHQGTASTVKIQIEELTSAGTLVGSASETACGTDIDLFTRVNVSRTILSSTCTELRITFYAVGASTFYADGVMLTRGIDALDYFLLNATDGSAGAGSADSAATTTYDTIAIDAESVNVTHPWVEVERNDQPWSHLKAIGAASLASYLGATPDNVLTMRVRYNETDEDINGDVEDIGSIGTSLSADGINSIAVYGSQVVKETGEELLYSGQADDRWTHDGGKLLYHAIASGAFAALSGATEHELKYDDSFDAGKFQ
jgi:hypothetical protein